MSNDPFPTVGTIARQHGATMWRVLYAIEKLGIEPVGRAGSANVYSPEAVEKIGAELRRIAEHRVSGKVSPGAAAVGA